MTPPVLCDVHAVCVAAAVAPNKACGITQEQWWWAGFRGEAVGVPGRRLCGMCGLRGSGINGG